MLGNPDKSIHIHRGVGAIGILGKSCTKLNPMVERLLMSSVIFFRLINPDISTTGNLFEGHRRFPKEKGKNYTNCISLDSKYLQT